MPLPALLRHRGLYTGLLVMLIGVSVWLNWPRPTLVNLPRLDAQALSALTTSRTDRHQLLVHLSSLLYRSDGRLAPWDTLPEVIQPLWITLCLELELELGSGIFLKPPQPGAPSYPDLAAGYKTLGAHEMGDLLLDLAPRLSDPALPPTAALRSEFDRRYLSLLPKAQSARLAYIHKHAEAIARP